MIKILDKYYPWDTDLLKSVTNRIIAGDELTINYKDKEAWINKWHKNPLQINIPLAEIYVSLGIVGEDSGNLETGDRHYAFMMR